MATLKIPPLHDGGPGKGDTAKAINMVKLRDRESGQNIILLNMHGLAGVQGPNGVNRNPERAKRVSYFMKQMEDLYQVGTKMKPKGIVFTTGDLNVDYRVDSRERDKNFPYKTFDRLNIWPSYRAFGMPKGGTHEAKPGEAMGNRLIDYVAHERKKKLKVIKQRIVRGFNTDHHMLAVDYNIGKSALPVDRDPDPDDKPLPPEDIEEEPIPEDDRPPEENPPHFC
jgi:hypothetical protein